MPPIDATIMLVCCLGLLMGGAVKGMLGVGLPMVAVPVMATVLPLPLAIAVMIAPILATNIVQIRIGSGIGKILARFWGLLIFLAIGILIGVMFLTYLQPRTLEIAIGVLVLGFVVIRSLSRPIAVSTYWENILSPLVGLGAGIVGGLSSFFGPPVMVYLLGIGLEKEDFIRTIAVTYVTGLVPLYAALAVLNVLGPTELAWSAAALGPALIGQWIGQYARRHISQYVFSIAMNALMSVLALQLILGLRA